MPVAHAELLNSVPTLGMQFANDCMFIAQTGGLAAQQRLASAKADETFVAHVRSTLQRLRQFGEQTVEDQLVSPRSGL